MAELSPEAQKLLAARKAAVEELKKIDDKDRPINDDDVIRLSGARMMVDALTLRMLAGEAVSPSDLKAANAMVDEALKDAGMRSHNIKVQFVEGCIGIYACVHCHKRNELQPGSYTPASGRHYEISGPNDTK